MNTRMDLGKYILNNSLYPLAIMLIGIIAFFLLSLYVIFGFIVFLIYPKWGNLILNEIPEYQKNMTDK